MSRLDEVLQRIDIAAADLSAMPGKSRKAVLQEAAKRYEAAEHASGSERADLVDWLCESSQHRIAFGLIRDINSALREIGPENLRRAAERAQPSRSDGWEKWADIRKHPIATVAAVAIITAGVSWKFFKEIEVKPLRQKIEQLESELSANASTTPSVDQQTITKSTPTHHQEPDKLTGKSTDDPNSPPH